MGCSVYAQRFNMEDLLNFTNIKLNKQLPGSGVEVNGVECHGVWYNVEYDEPYVVQANLYERTRAMFGITTELSMDISFVEHGDDCDNHYGPCRPDAKIRYLEDNSSGTAITKTPWEDMPYGKTVHLEGHVVEFDILFVGPCLAHRMLKLEATCEGKQDISATTIMYFHVEL